MASAQQIRKNDQIIKVKTEIYWTGMASVLILGGVRGFTLLFGGGIIPSYNYTAILSIIAVSRVPEALGQVREEYEQTKAERDAFAQFIQFVAGTEPATTATISSGSKHQSPTQGTEATIINQSNTVQSSLNAQSGSIKPIRQKYRETVMSVDHYDEVYAEPLEENLTAELGASVSNAIINSDVLTNRLQTIIIKKSRQVRKQRTDFLHQVEKEREALVERRRELRKLNESTTTIEETLYPRPIGEVIQLWDRLDDLETECRELLQDRQSRIHTGSNQIPSLEVQEYMYYSYDWVFPVLADGLDTLTRIHSIKQTTTEAIYNW